MDWKRRACGWFLPHEGRSGRLGAAGPNAHLAAAQESAYTLHIMFDLPEKLPNRGEKA